MQIVHAGYGRKYVPYYCVYVVHCYRALQICTFVIRDWYKLAAPADTFGLGTICSSFSFLFHPFVPFFADVS